MIIFPLNFTKNGTYYNDMTNSANESGIEELQQEPFLNQNVNRVEVQLLLLLKTLIYKNLL